MRNFLTLCLTGVLLQACASSNVQSQKTPGADMWNYHVYSWRSHPSNSEANSEQPVLEKTVKERVDYKLTKQGMIHVSERGNPDVWVTQRSSPQGISLEFVDAHTGATYWQGQASFSDSAGQPTSNRIHSAVDDLIDQYVAAHEWMPASFWYTGITMDDQ